MKVLFVVSGNANKLSPFIQEQTDSIKEKGIIIDFFFIKGKGAWGYIKNIFQYYNKLNTFRPNIVHAHYGLSGLFANLQFKIPVITTFHGSDVNINKIKPFSILAHLLSRYSIFVSDKIAKKITPQNNYTVIPCGVNTKVFFPINKKEIRENLGYGQDEKLILFSNNFNNSVKNYPLAKKAIALFNEDIKLIELKGYSRAEVNELLNACDVALMTSFLEGSPQFIKEAMACNCPIVSTDVGDVRDLIESTEGCYISSYEPLDVKNAIEKAIYYNKKTEGRQKISTLSLECIANQIIDLYLSIKNK